MTGFIITVGSNHRGWYLFGTIFFVLLGIALSIIGFAATGPVVGVVGLVVTVAAGVMMADAIANFV